MEKIKQFITNNFEPFFILSSITVASLFILMVRLKITHSFFFLFLVWNLFLAAIPYAISVYMTQIKKLHKIGFGIGFVAWLLFLPNAPYIITDLIHLRHSGSTQIWFDTIMIGLFALGGLLFYLYSLRQIQQLWLRFTSETSTKRIQRLIPFLVGFGIYLGRVLRWNSWDLIQRPQQLVSDCLGIFIHPIENILAWALVLFFGFGLNLSYSLFIKLSNK